VRHLGDALTRGAAPKLCSWTLILSENPAASHAAKEAVQDVLKQRQK